MRALFSAASGTLAQQFNIDVIANNVANVNTSGFKKVRTEFQDLLSQTFQAPGALTAQGTNCTYGYSGGFGVPRYRPRSGVFLPGSVIQTGNTFDMAIQGNGMFQVLMPSGRNGLYPRWQL